MSQTPLLTVRCPQDLLDGINRQMKETGASKTEVVVSMLKRSSPFSIAVLDKSQLPEKPAIYFVTTTSNKLLYIGQTKNLKQRWQNHHRFGQFIEADKDSRITWFEFNDDLDRSALPVVESALIQLLDSEYNGESWLDTGITPLLTVRCPQDLLDGISETMNATGQNKTEVVVDMLRNSVPSLPILERSKLPQVSAIYFVITPSNKLLYIGQTKNLFNRFLQHHRYQQFIETSAECRIAWFEFDESDSVGMPLIEDELITLLDSEYNGAAHPTDRRGKAVTCYLPEDIEQYLTQYSTEYSITRKDKNGEVKPSLGTGIVEILKHFFQGENTLPGSLPSHALSFEQLKPLIEEAVKSNLPSIVNSSVPTAERIEETIERSLPSTLLHAEDLAMAIAQVREEFLGKLPA
jgi:predicted GIY-YIG superfamily endonuclease